jgi:hypothetical protein
MIGAVVQCPYAVNAANHIKIPKRAKGIARDIASALLSRDVKSLIMRPRYS